MLGRRPFPCYVSPVTLPAVVALVVVLYSPLVESMATRTSKSFSTVSVPRRKVPGGKGGCRSDGPRVAIIGAGAAGLAAARAFRFCAPVVFEQSAHLGGVWRYQEASKVHPMYRGLRTNLPKELMAYFEFPFDDEATPASFVTHSQVLAYLQSYCDHFQLSSFIRFNTKVEHLEVLTGTSSSFCSTWPCVRIHYQSIAPHDSSATGDADLDGAVSPSALGATAHSETFDAVCICNGHYSVPFIPKLPGLENAERFGIRFLHSIAYDNPEVFSGERVLCVGGRASGSDLARELVKHASTVYLSDSTYQRNEPWTEHGVTLLPRTVRILPNSSVECFDEREAGKPQTIHVDVILFCTGYDYHFPFIKSETSNLQLQVGERRVAPLLEQLWHAEIPNLAFMGLPHSVVPFPLTELQAQACLYQWAHAGKDLPEAREERVRVASKDAAAGGPSGSGNVRDTHYLGNFQWNYCRKMAEHYAPHTWNADYKAYLRTNETLYNHTSLARKGKNGLLDDFPAVPDLYRSIRYHLDVARGIVEVTSGIWDHAGSQRKEEGAAFPGAPDTYRETVYRRIQDSNNSSFRVVFSLI